MITITTEDVQEIVADIGRNIETGIPGLVQSFREADVPHANPPEAATVLETQTAPEVAGEPEPLTEEQVAEIAKAEKLEEFNAERATRGEKPLKRMPPERKARRTAPVVQVELDEALAEIERLKLTQDRAGGTHGGQVIELQDTLTKRDDQIASQRDALAEVHEAIATQRGEIERLHALPMTASAVQDRDKTIAELRANEARAAETATQMAKYLQLKTTVIATLTDDLDARTAELMALKREPNPAPEVIDGDSSVDVLAGEITRRGWKVSLSR